MLAGILLLLQPMPVSAQKNVLILYPEDMGMHLSSLGTPGIDTPVLDALGKQGARFTSNFCPPPVCSPSKGGFYTGRFPHDNGMTSNVHNFAVGNLPFPEAVDLSVMLI